MNVAIAGYGVEGEQNYRYWSRLGHDVTIVDEKSVPDRELPSGAKTLLGSDVFSHLEGFDLVIRTAGLAPRRITTNGKVWSATNEFFAKCPAPVVGVTGTKGKGTTASLIASILQAAGKTVHLVGNIGVPALEVLENIKQEDIVVYELSSFQLWDIEKSPHISVVLPIEPDHLNVHKDFDDYVAAKANIAKYQHEDDTVVYYSSRNGIEKQIAQLSPGQKIPYLYQTSAYVVDGYFYYNEQKLCSTSSLLIPGQHNIENACAAISAAWPYVQDADYIEQGLRSFEGLPHRLKFVRELKGVQYFDDSISTTPGSAVAALNSFDGHKVIILGGSEKGGSYDELIALCNTSGAVVVAMGGNSETIVSLCHDAGVHVVQVKEGIGEVVNVARDEAEPHGGVVILSPAAASFDGFRNYSDRGDQFISAVMAL